MYAFSEKNKKKFQGVFARGSLIAFPYLYHCFSDVKFIPSVENGAWENEKWMACYIFNPAARIFPECDYKASKIPAE